MALGHINTCSSNCTLNSTLISLWAPLMLQHLININAFIFTVLLWYHQLVIQGKERLRQKLSKAIANFGYSICNTWDLILHSTLHLTAVGVPEAWLPLTGSCLPVLIHPEYPTQGSRNRKETHRGSSFTVQLNPLCWAVHCKGEILRGKENKQIK